MLTVRALIEGLGGTGKAADALSVTPSAVSHWIGEDAIPPGRHIAVWTLAKRAGLDWHPPGADALLVRGSAA